MKYSSLCGAKLQKVNFPCWLPAWPKSSYLHRQQTKLLSRNMWWESMSKDTQSIWRVHGSILGCACPEERYWKKVFALVDQAGGGFYWLIFMQITKPVQNCSVLLLPKLLDIIFSKKFPGKMISLNCVMWQDAQRKMLQMRLNRR